MYFSRCYLTSTTIITRYISKYSLSKIRVSWIESILTLHTVEAKIGFNIDLPLSLKKRS